MPITGLYFCPDSGTTQSPANTITDRLSKRYQPINIGKWSMEHRLLREITYQNLYSTNNANSTSGESNGTTNPSSNSNQARFMQYLDLSHHPGKKFCLVDKFIVTIDAEFETILTTKLNGIWAMRQTLKADGHVYELDDFIIRIATVSQGSVMKGVLVEVEYLPCNYLAEGAPIISDFVERLELPKNATSRLHISSNSFQDKKGEGANRFTELDTGMQYMELLRLR